jgi:hypothetical protein
MESISVAEDVRIVHLGQGGVVSNWGTYHGLPCVFIEPVVSTPGIVGEKVPDGAEPQITKTSVSSGGIVFVIHNPEGAKVVMEDFQSALEIKN